MSLSGASSRNKTLAAYGVMLLLAIGLYFLIRSHGLTLSAPEPTELAHRSSPKPPSHVLLHVLLALAVVTVASRALGMLFRLIRQPPVIGEVIAGILLGPSLLGAFAPGAQEFLFGGGIAQYLGIVAQVGVILFMFLVGLELDTRTLRERSHTTIAISHASIVLPFLLGALLALFLYPRLSSDAVGFTNFSLFMGVSLSVTAFPVLARILTDSGLSRSTLGVVSLACAAVDDATAWCLLALVVGIVRANSSSSFVTLALTVVYVSVMLFFLRPLVQRWVQRVEVVGKLRQGASAVVLIGLLLSALATEAIGIHALFGAFLLGAIVPHESLLAREMTRRLEDFVVVLLLPAFFAFTGLRTQIGLLHGITDWLYCGAIILVASIGKFCGSALAARFGGFGWRDACSLGVLMNTRGLMELIVLNVGFELGVISPRLFAMLVIMAVVTTFATAPLLQLLNPSLRLGAAVGSPAR